MGNTLRIGKITKLLRLFPRGFLVSRSTEFLWSLSLSPDLLITHQNCGNKTELSAGANLVISHCMASLVNAECILWIITNFGALAHTEEQA